LGFGIWNFHSIGMDLFFKILLKDPLIFLLQHLEGHFAIGTQDQITGPFIPI
jgi:hypothetical protein